MVRSGLAWAFLKGAKKVKIRWELDWQGKDRQGADWSGGERSGKVRIGMGFFERSKKGQNKVGTGLAG